MESGREEGGKRGDNVVSVAFVDGDENEGQNVSERVTQDTCRGAVAVRLGDDCDLARVSIG